MDGNILYTIQDYTLDNFCTVHGEWSVWAQWESCSSACGSGLRKRHRTCTNPPPSMYGNYCRGDPVEYSLCKGTECGNHSTSSESLFYSVGSFILTKLALISVAISRFVEKMKRCILCLHGDERFEFSCMSSELVCWCVISREINIARSRTIRSYLYLKPNYEKRSWSPFHEAVYDRTNS